MKFFQVRVFLPGPNIGKEGKLKLWKIKEFNLLDDAMAYAEQHTNDQAEAQTVVYEVEYSILHDSRDEMLIELEL
jgi:hypothetical protein